MNSRPVKCGIYRHYKGRSYAVIGTAHHSETLEELVVYRALYVTPFGRNSLWVRPRSMFTGSVVVDGKQAPRFQYVGKNIVCSKGKGEK